MLFSLDKATLAVVLGISCALLSFQACQQTWTTNNTNGLFSVRRNLNLVHTQENTLTETMAEAVTLPKEDAADNTGTTTTSEDENSQHADDDNSDDEYTDIPPLTIKGYKMFNSQTGQDTIIRGIDYYPRPNSGPLDDNSVDFFTSEYSHIWQRDIPQFQALNVNAIRLYAVDPNQDHSEFMCALNQAGIYVLVELASGSSHGEDCAILSSKAPHCYPRHLKRRGERIIKEFSRYSNTLAFSAGNEVNHFVPLGKPPQWNAPCLKKFVRDMRAYVHKCSNRQGTNVMRHVPIGLIMADSDRDENANYYNCQSNPKDDLEHAEWYGINTYVYCNGTATKYDEAKGFKTLIESFKTYDYSIPVLLTEFGCLSTTFPTEDGYVGQRTFHQAEWLANPEVRDIFAGGLVFEYSMETANARVPFPFKVFGEQNYGVGYLSPEGCDDVTVMCEYNRTPSFAHLSHAYEQVEEEMTMDTNSGNISTMEDFVPEVGRRGRTPCPAEFPSLNSFRWKTDLTASISCPFKRAEPFQCSSVLKAMEERKKNNDMNPIVPITSTPPPTYGPMHVVLFLIAILLCAFIFGFAKAIVEMTKVNNPFTVVNSDGVNVLLLKEVNGDEDESKPILSPSSTAYMSVGSSRSNSG